MKVGIVGLGLMGGSMGLALKKTHRFERILGYDTNPIHLQQALSLGLVDECVSIQEIFKCDVIFLAVPVDGIVKILSEIDAECVNPNTTIIDLGGTKSQINHSISPVLRPLFVGAHPMCGTEFFGPKAAFDTLYCDNIVILTDLDQSGAYQAELAKDLFIAIGMKIIKMDSVSHDKHIALISHMPHIISYALANAVLAQEDPQMILALVGGGFRSMSRLSKSSPTMWKDIFKQNKDNVLCSIAYFQDKLNEAKEFIEGEDWESLEAFMAQANTLQKFL